MYAISYVRGYSSTILFSETEQIPNIKIDLTTIIKRARYIDVKYVI